MMMMLIEVMEKLPRGVSFNIRKLGREVSIKE